jgi:Rrf2 family protein
VKAENVARAQAIPLHFLENILGELRNAGIVRSHRGPDGGFRLAKPPEAITIADIIRAVEGPLATVRGGPPEDSEYQGAATALPRVWIAVRHNLRAVMENVTIEDLVRGELPTHIERLAEHPEDWVTRRGSTWPGGNGHPPVAAAARSASGE